MGIRKGDSVPLDPLPKGMIPFGNPMQGLIQIYTFSVVRQGAQPLTDEAYMASYWVEAAKNED